MKHYLKIAACGIGLGVVLVIVQQILQIDKENFLYGYYIVAGILIVSIFLFNLLYVRFYQKKMHQAILLLEAGKADEYLVVVQHLLKRAKGRYLKNLLTLNLTAGYCDLKQYEQAIDILENLSKQKLRGQLKMVQQLNLCACYFYTKQNDRAIELYESSQKIFKPFRSLSIYGGNFAILDIFAAIERGEYAKAFNLLEYAQKTWKNPRLQDDYLYLKKLLEESNKILD